MSGPARDATSKRVTDKALVLSRYRNARCVRDGIRWRIYFRPYEIESSVCGYSPRRAWEIAAAYVERELRGGPRIGAAAK